MTYDPAYHKAYNQKDREKLLEYHGRYGKRWRATHRRGISRFGRDYYQKNRENVVKRSKEYSKTHSEAIGAYQRKNRERSKPQRKKRIEEIFDAYLSSLRS